VDLWLIRSLAIAGIPISCVLSGYVGFLFGALKANPWWSTPLMPVIFLVSAIISGIAALILLYQFICWRRGVRPDSDCVRALARDLWVFLILAVSLETLELGQLAYEASGEWHILSTLITEHLAVSFGLVQVLIGSVCPLLLLSIALYPKLNVRLVAFFGGAAALLVLVQVFAMRWNIVVGGQLFSKSFRGFIDYEVPLGGREGWVAATIVLVLPLLALWVAAKFVPVGQDESYDEERPLQLVS
jgi:formate-dependent nitrite reductase membrane component NrfD